MLGHLHEGRREGVQMQNEQGALPAPNWDLWAHMPKVELWQAVALSMPMDPEAVNWDRNGWMAGGADVLTIDDAATFRSNEDAARFRGRYTLLEACYWHPPFTRPVGASPLYRSPVKLLEFATWASSQQLFEPLPEALRALMVRSSPANPAGSANWDKWRLMPRVPLWKAVCLSFDLEPRVDIHENHLRNRGRFVHGVPNLQDRLEILQANLSTNGPIHPQGALYAGILQKPDCLVLLSEVAAFLAAKGIEIPAEMAALAPQAAQEPQAAPEVTGSASDCVGAPPHGWKMRVQAAAAEHWKRLRASGANPTVHSIVDWVAKWCKENDVLTDGAINPSANYLRTHVLSSKHWTPPD